MWPQKVKRRSVARRTPHRLAAADEVRPLARRPRIGVDEERVAEGLRERQLGEKGELVAVEAARVHSTTARASATMLGCGPCTTAASWLPMTATAPAATCSRKRSTTHAGSAP
jgi:hypothetical protein